MVSYSEKHEERAAQIAARLSAVLLESSLHVAVAESLTGGKIATQLAAAPHSGEWFAGGVVCYSAAVKHGLLEVPAGPVISQEAVEAMVRTVSRIMDADVAAAASGAGGPEGQEGQEPGTTWIAVLAAGHVRSELHHFAGDPLEVLAQTEERVLAILWEAVAQHCGVDAE